MKPFISPQQRQGTSRRHGIRHYRTGTRMREVIWISIYRPAVETRGRKANALSQRNKHDIDQRLANKANTQYRNLNAEKTTRRCRRKPTNLLQHCSGFTRCKQNKSGKSKHHSWRRVERRARLHHSKEGEHPSSASMRMDN
eukprot:GFKZ01008557.1.p1 GENE.GFKZ01008557.1~~GFKZ01008557.1.p1  ORF type:complete len:141 (+),score=12.68 GFKZ01008557.1:200-622(+)